MMRGLGSFALLMGVLCAADLSAAVVDVVARGVVADGKTCQAAVLEKIVAEAPDGTEFVFPAGEYYLARTVCMRAKKHVVFRGAKGARIKLHFSPWGEVRESNGAFHCADCVDLRFENFAFTTDNPSSCAGRIVAKHPETGTYDVAIDPQFPITGWEHFWGTDTCDDEGMPDYAIETYAKISRAQVPDGKGGTRTKITGDKYEVIGPQLVRVTAPFGRKFDFNRIRIGHRVLYRYIIYGSTVFSIQGCSDVVFRDIEIERCASMGAVVSPPSRNVTFERFNMRSPKGSAALYCANADGIHILGLTGFLKMNDCHFDGLGDDALNIHAKSGEVKAWNPATGEMTCICRNTSRAETKLPHAWAAPGEKLVVYDQKTLLTKGYAVLEAYADGKAKVKLAGAPDIRVGDYLANDKDFASVHISNCSVRNTRARALLLQSRNMTVENCFFRGLSLPGVIVATDFRHWNEVGPTVNTEIRNCVFEKCCRNGSRANLGALMVKTSHDAAFEPHPAGVHRDIRIFGNTFRDCGNSGVFVQSTQGVKVRGNRFERCSTRRYDPKDPDNLYDIRIFNCEDVALAENTTTKDAKLLSLVRTSAPPPAKLLCEWREDEGVGEMPAVPGLECTDAFTLAIRANWNKPKVTGYPNLLSGHGWGGEGSMLLFVNGSRLSFRVGSSDGMGKTTWHETEATALTKLPDTWTSVAVTFARPLYTVYVDGKPVSKLKWDEPFRMKGFQLGGWGGGARHDGRLDDLRVYDRALTADEVAALAAEGEWHGKPKPPKPVVPAVVYTGRQATLTFDKVGRLSSLKETATGRELVEVGLPFISVVRTAKPPLTARRVEARGKNRLAFVFPSDAGEAVFKVEPFGADDGWMFTLEKLSVEGAEEVRMANIRPTCNTWQGTMANICSDESSAVALRAFDVALSMSASPNGLVVRGERKHGMEGMRFGLAAGPREGFIGQLRAMSKASGAPLSTSGGAWSLGSDACRGSYMFADLSLQSVDDWIDLAERGGIQIVHFHGWWQWLGQYPVNTNYFPRGLADMKTAVDKVHAAGLKAGMHSLTACINPYQDPWISPVCSTDLVADATYTLAAPLAADGTEILVNEKPVAKHDLVFTYSSNGNFLRLGHEVVQYTGVRREKPYAFTGCKRGYFKTKPAAYPAGEQCDYLHQRYIAFYPAPDSPLADDLASRLANVRNVCGIDSFYFDGSEGMGTRYGIDKLRHLIYGHFSAPPVAEASCWGAHNWWFHSRIGAWDHAVWGAKRFHDAHVRSTVESARKANFMEPQMGWWQPRVGSAQARGHYSEEMEYFAGKNAGFDAAMSQQGVNVTGGPLSEFLTRQFTLLGWYERARLARAFSDEAVARLAAPQSEHRLRQGADGVWTLTTITSIVHRVTGCDAANWRFALPRAATGTLRVEALYGAAPHDAPNGTNFLAAADVAALRVETAGGVKATATPVTATVPGRATPETGVRLAAKNVGKTSRGAWACAKRSYEFPYMSLGNNAAFGFWVKGDGSGAVLNLQLVMAREYLGGVCEHYVTLDFAGWRYVTLLARERDADAFADLSWPYSGAVMDVHRDPYDGRHVQRVALWLNEVPAGGATTVEVVGLRALPVVKPELKDAAVTLNGQALKVPFTLAAGDYAELEDGAWIHYSQTGTSLARVPASAPSFVIGENVCSFTGTTGVSPVDVGDARAEVTVLARGASFPAFRALDAATRKGLAYEAMLPFPYAPAKGLDATPRLAVRPGETAALELVVHGPISKPTFDFGAKGRFVFPVTLKKNERLVCRDGRAWRVLAKPRTEVAHGELAQPLPMFAAGTDWTFSGEDPASADARVELVKRYR